MTHYSLLARSFIVVVLILTTASCYKDLPLPGANGTKKIVLLGEFTAGDSLLLRAGQSIVVASNRALRMELVSGLMIDVADTAAGNYPMGGFVDEYVQILYTIPFLAQHKAVPGHTYRVSALHPVMGTATASVRIPEQIVAVVTDTLSAVYQSDSTLRIKVRIKDPVLSSNYYVLEAVKQQMFIEGYFLKDGDLLSIRQNRDMYEAMKAAGPVTTSFDTAYSSSYIRLPVYTTDPNTENVGLKGGFTSSSRILLKDKAFNGGDYEVTLYAAKNNTDFTTENPKGRMIFYIKSVSEDYFRYLRSYELSNPSVYYNSFDQPVKLEGNVQNGAGMIGGVSRITYTYITDNWDF
jgi:hypothetical protein